MRFRKALVAAAALVVFLWPSKAGAEPIHFTRPFEVHIEGVEPLKLPPGYYFSEEERDKLDLHVRKIEDENTNLRAQNDSLRSSAGTSKWFVLGVATLALIVGGVVGSVAF